MPEQRVVERLPHGDAIGAAAGRGEFFIIQALLRCRANPDLLAPEWLREKMTEEARRLAGVYRALEMLE